MKYNYFFHLLNILMALLSKNHLFQLMNKKHHNYNYLFYKYYLHYHLYLLNRCYILEDIDELINYISDNNCL